MKGERGNEKGKEAMWKDPLTIFTNWQPCRKLRN
jgi:hypothetical protein